MTSARVNQIRALWNERAAQSTAEVAVTHPDIWQRWLEIETVKQFVKPQDRFIDIGCGTGYLTKLIAPLAREALGIDYADPMICRAQDPTLQDQQPDNLTFATGDVTTLTPDSFGRFDVALTCRCLINLPDWETQQQALLNIANILNPNGTLLLIEGEQGGRRRLNQLRESVGLKPMPAVWHNLDFDAAHLIAFCKEHFDVEEQRHFGVYDYVSRVVHPLVALPREPQYDARINEVAARLALTSQDHGDISRVIVLLLRKKRASRSKANAREAQRVPLTKPCLDGNEAQAATRAILSGWVTQGTEVAAFEQEFADYVGAHHACAVSSCTAALHLALLAAGVQPEDEVITVSHSYIATANSIRYCGAVPVFVDILPESFNIDPAAVARAVTSRTRAVLCVHQMGMPCNIPEILRIVRQHDLVLIEDAACAIGSEIDIGYRWERIGKPHGDIACFSLHPRKVITTGDGGMLTTANEALAQRIKRLRQHSMSIPDIVRHTTNEIVFESYPELGFNYRMTDVQAAVGREQLKKLPDIVQQRRRLARRYADQLENIPGLHPPHEPQFARSNWQSYCVRLPEQCVQQQVMQTLLDQSIVTRRGIMCAHREPAYNGRQRHNLSHSEQAQDHAIILPLYPQMTDQQQDAVVCALDNAVRTK